MRQRAIVRALCDRLRADAMRLLIYRCLRAGFTAALLTVGAFTVLGMTTALVGGAPFDGVSRDAYRVGAFIRLNVQGNGEMYLRGGWQAADKHGRWVGEPAALLEIPSKAFPSREIFLHVEAHKNEELGKSEVYLDVLANGVPLGRIKAPPPGEEPRTYWLTVPASVVKQHDETLILCLFASPAGGVASGAFQSSLVKIDEVHLAETI